MQSKPYYKINPINLRYYQIQKTVEVVICKEEHQFVYLTLIFHNVFGLLSELYYYPILKQPKTLYEYDVYQIGNAEIGVYNISKPYQITM